MTYLFLSIICSSLLTIFFKIFEKLKINTFQAIVVNYLVAAAIALSLSVEKQKIEDIYREDWFFAAFILGTLFISIFNALAFTAQKIGITVATVANKMSLVIPVVAAVFLYDTSLGTVKLVGILIALLAIYLSTYKPTGEKALRPGKKYFLIPVIVFIGSGAMDTIINYSQVNLLQDSEYELFLAVVFGIAGAIGLMVLLYKLFYSGERFSFKAAGSGFLLGIVNYGSMYAIVKALNSNVLDAAIFFSVNNIGIVAFSSVSAYFLFKEKMSLVNWVGIVLCIVAIVTVAYKTVLHAF